MARIAFATCRAWSQGRPDDRRVAEALGATFEVWDEEAADWQAYDRVVIRSVWDYSHRVGEFLQWCNRVGPARLRNTPELIAFNTDKRYLATLPVPTVPTVFLEPGSQLGEPYRHEVVVKPNISAGARDTGRFGPQDPGGAAALIAKIHASGRAALVQPYLPRVDSEGETAIVFFAGQLSHVLHKRPVLRAAGVAPLAEMAHAPAAVMLEDDLVTAGSATEPQRALADAAHRHIAERFGTPLYARIDMVPGPDGAPVVMELELTEPNLYLDLVPGSDQRFASAVLRELASVRGG
jgi:hypothetical protein